MRIVLICFRQFDYYFDEKYNFIHDFMTHFLRVAQLIFIMIFLVGDFFGCPYFDSLRFLRLRD